jgi:quercetin dioxygenase-like cupin family protein/alkylhydroperoxidase/carboxymuconolactone decarboxylase family protein YurZ
MKLLAAIMATIPLFASSSAQADQTKAAAASRSTLDVVRVVAPALEKYAEAPLAHLWKRPGLSLRDRSIITLAALIARNQTIEMPTYLNLALDNTRRRMLGATGGLAALAAARPAAAETPIQAVPSRPRNGTMEIKRIGSQPSRKGPAEYFTGTVRIEPLFQAPEPARVSGGSVTFEPGARTAWQTHPLGQNLIITSGLGWIQRAGGPIEEVRPGDVVWFPPGEKHWHGATPTTAMTHIAVQESLNAKNVDWLEKVSDEQYRQ